MIDFGQVYVVDTNALSELRRHRRESPFFRENVLLPAEVLHEAEGFPDIEGLRRNVYPASASLLRFLLEVMRAVPTDDTTLIDLYANRGGADPILIACALDGLEQDSPFLDSPEWIIVTGDEAVRRTARAFQLPVLSSQELAERIDAADGTHLVDDD